GRGGPALALHRQPGLRDALGGAAEGRATAREPPWRRAGLSDREHVGAPRAAERDEVDVRPVRPRAARGAADRLLAPPAPDARVDHLAASRRGDRAVADGARRLLPELPAHRPGGRGRPQVVRSGRARTGDCLARGGARYPGRVTAPARPDDYLADLNPAQREAVLTTEGPLLVIAGA